MVHSCQNDRNVVTCHAKAPFYSFNSRCVSSVEQTGSGVTCMPALQVPDPKLKYQQLLAYGKKLPRMPQEDHTDENKVRGCVSQVSI